MSAQTIMCISEVESEFESSVSAPNIMLEPEYPSEVESSKFEPSISFDTLPYCTRDESLIEAVLARLRVIYYQYEVTFVLYMLTPGEKIVLNSIFAFLLALTGYGIFLMLPQFVIRAAGYWFWDCIGKKEHAVRQVFRLNTTGSSWDAIHPAIMR